jgi:NADPH2:quinone reductase
MKAVLCKQFGPPDSLRVEDLPSPRAGPGEAVISVKAASLNFPDVLIIQNKYQFKPPLPFSPGSELAGVVKEIGPGVQGWRPGDKVIAFTTYGAFAEEVKTDPSRLVPLPEKMDFVTLAAGETLLVLGAAGGVGLAAIEIGKALGARVIACASSEDKLAVCRSHGADATINYATEDLRERIKALTEGRGVDVVYDPVGGPYTEPAFRSLAWRGRHLVVGFAAGEIPKLPLNLALLKGASVVGVFWGDFARRQPKEFAQSIGQLARWYADGKLKPHVSHTMPLEKAAEALKLMAARQVTGKLVLTVSTAG